MRYNLCSHTNPTQFREIYDPPFFNSPTTLNYCALLENILDIWHRFLIISINSKKHHDSEINSVLRKPSKWLVNWQNCWFSSQFLLVLSCAPYLRASSTRLHRFGSPTRRLLHHLSGIFVGAASGGGQLDDQLLRQTKHPWLLLLPTHSRTLIVSPLLTSLRKSSSSRQWAYLLFYSVPIGHPRRQALNLPLQQVFRPLSPPNDPFPHLY